MIPVISNMPVGTIGLRVGHKPGPVWDDTKMWFKNLKGWERPRHRLGRRLARERRQGVRLVDAWGGEGLRVRRRRGREAVGGRAGR